jgi:hypothetical protein
MVAMKKLRIIGMAFVVALALSAIVASTAMAGEYGRCVKLETSTGRYENAGCTTKSGSHTGKYEWHAGPGAKPGYISATGVAKLKSAGGEIECKASTDAGKITGATTDTDTITFTGCVLIATAGKCHSAGQAAGTIKTNLLDTSLLDHGTKGLSGLEPKEDEVWTQFVSSENEPYQAQFECEPGILFRVSGSLSCNTTPVNVMTTTLSLTCEEAAKKLGEQDLITEISEDGGAEWSAGAPSEEIIPGKATVTPEEAIEVRACNEKGAKSEGKGAPACIE